MSFPSMHMASDAFCIAERDVAKLSACKVISARLVGPGFDETRKFALVLVQGRLHFADVVTGTLYDDAGEHHSSPQLRLHGLPAKVKQRDVAEVR